MKQSLLPLLFFLLLLPFSAKAAPIDSITARHRLSTERFRRSGLHRADFQLRAADRWSYVFGTRDGEFVIMAADDRLPEVLAYGCAPTDEMPEPVRAFRESLARCQGHTLPAPAHHVPIAPLLGEMVRHQKDPFNRHCPYYRNDQGEWSDERCVVGCVATAMEEVMTYHQRTVTLRDTLKGWETDHYAVADILPGASVDTRQILPQYNEGAYTEEQADAVARLSYWLGVACHMNWGTGESGANIRRLVDPLQRVMGWQYVRHVDSYKYTTDNWWALIESELRAGRPVLYAAYTMRLQGHAFVVDGLDADGFVHVNWGYGGNYDGYFRLDILNFYEPKWDMTEEGAEMVFFCNHEALLAAPDEVTPAEIDTLARTGHEVSVLSMRPLLNPERGRYTPIEVVVRNETDLPLTTPFELFTNQPTDTAWFEQADYIALTGARLAPHETRRLEVAAKFIGLGQRHLRISPDDEAVLCDTLIEILNTPAPQLSYDPPLLTFPDETTACIVQQIHNAAEAGRSGHITTYQMVEGTDLTSPEGTTHQHRIYLAPGATLADTIAFRALQPGHTYTLLVRSNWVLMHTVRFVQGDPASVGISAPEIDPSTDSSPRPTAPSYTISGLRIPHPEKYRGLIVTPKGVRWKGK